MKNHHVNYIKLKLHQTKRTQAKYVLLCHICFWYDQDRHMASGEGSPEGKPITVTCALTGVSNVENNLSAKHFLRVCFTCFNAQHPINTDH